MADLQCLFFTAGYAEDAINSFIFYTNFSGGTFLFLKNWKSIFYRLLQIPIKSKCVFFKKNTRPLQQKDG